MWPRSAQPFPPLKGAEFEVQTGLEDVDVRCDTNAGGRYAAHGHGTGQCRRVIVVEPIVLVVFYEAARCSAPKRKRVTALSPGSCTTASPRPGLFLCSNLAISWWT